MSGRPLASHPVRSRPVRSRPRFGRALLGMIALWWGLAVQAAPLTVFAAASLGSALQPIADQWVATGREPVVLSLAGTSSLARQIAHGAPADVFLSANEAWMDQLQSKGLLAPGSRVDLLGNELVLIAHGSGATAVEVGPALDLPAMLAGRRLAMALVDAVPAGMYGRSALQALGLWTRVAPSVAQADNVRVALAWVASGETPLGIVYATDAIAEPRVSVIGRFPVGSHPPIVYPGAVLAASRHRDARDFLNFLNGPAARRIFETQGFRVLSR
ncbi:MAG: molybdate ABC transporter substrate-binding protein [Burkholderiaceae bacterium]